MTFKYGATTAYNALKIIKYHWYHERNTAQVAIGERVSKELDGQCPRFSLLRHEFQPRV